MLEPCSPVQGFSSVWMWGGCCCDFDLVGVLYGVCKICNYYILLLIFLCVIIIIVT